MAALEIASIETPDLDQQPFLAILDRMASAIAARLPSGATGREFVAAANQYFFDELGFHGNEIDYNDPRNSCLDHVLDRRTGLPITLSVVYIEVARRLGQPVSGIGLPGHFIVEYKDGEFAAYIDPFHSGRLLTLGRLPATRTRAHRVGCRCHRPGSRWRAVHPGSHAQ